MWFTQTPWKTGPKTPSSSVTTYVFPPHAGLDDWQTSQSSEERKDEESAFIWNRDSERGCCHDNDLLLFFSVLFVGPVPQWYDSHSRIDMEAAICLWFWLISVLGASLALSRLKRFDSNKWDLIIQQPVLFSKRLRVLSGITQEDVVRVVSWSMHLFVEVYTHASSALSRTYIAHSANSHMARWFPRASMLI